MDKQQIKDSAYTLQTEWMGKVSSDVVPEYKQFIVWIQMFGLQPCISAVPILRKRVQQWLKNGEAVNLSRACAYLSGTARNIKQQAELLREDGGAQ